MTSGAQEPIETLPDQLASGRPSVWVVDDKSLAGRITGDEMTWVLPNGSHRRGELNKAMHAAKLLRGRIVNKNPDLKPIWIEGVVTLSNDKVDFAVQDSRVSTNILHLKGCEKYFLNPPFKKLRKLRLLSQDDRETVLRSLIGNLYADRLLSRSSGRAVPPTETKTPLTPIQDKSGRAVYLQMDGEGGFRRVYYEDIVVGRNELRGARPLDATRKLEGTGIRLRFQTDGILVSPVNGLCDVSLGRRPIQFGEVLQIPRGTNSLKIGEIELKVTVSDLP